MEKKSYIREHMGTTQEPWELPGAAQKVLEAGGVEII